MAEVTLGLWTTHGPTLSTTPEQWLLRLPADHARNNHSFRGGVYDFDTLVAMRADEHLAEQATLPERTRRKQACDAAIERMADIFGAKAHFKPERVFKMARSKAYLFGGVEIRWSCAPEALAGVSPWPTVAQGAGAVR